MTMGVGTAGQLILSGGFRGTRSAAHQTAFAGNDGGRRTGPLTTTFSLTSRAG